MSAEPRRAFWYFPAIAFLKGIGLSPEIRAMVVGYDDAADEEGWKLLRAACRKRTIFYWTQEREKNKANTGAIAAFLEQSLAIAKATLVHEFPSFMTPLLGGLSYKKSEGFVSVVTTHELLRRLDELEAEPKNAKVLEALAARGITKERRIEIAARVKTLMGGDSSRDEDGKQALQDEEAWDAELNAAREGLRAWYLAWSTVAHQDVKRRDLLIRLGLGERKKRAAAKKVPA